MTHVTLLDELFDINVIQVSLSDTIVITNPNPSYWSGLRDPAHNIRPSSCGSFLSSSALRSHSTRSSHSCNVSLCSLVIIVCKCMRAPGHFTLFANTASSSLASARRSSYRTLAGGEETW
jgi:hypothetical protein